MSYHHHANEMARGLVNDAPLLPSFKDLVAFRSHNASFRADQGSEPSRSQRKEYVVERSPRQHPEESFEIVGVKRASAQTPQLNTVQPQHRAHHGHHYREQALRPPEKALPLHDHRGHDQRHEHAYFSPQRYAGHPLQHARSESEHGKHASQLNGRSKAEYRPEREAMLPHRHESRQEPGHFSYPQHRHDGRKSQPSYPQERCSNLVDQEHHLDQVRPGYRNEESYPPSIATVDLRRRESSMLQVSNSVQARSHRQRDPPEYSPAPNREHTPARRREIKIDSERTGSVTTLNDLRRLRNHNDRPRHAPTDARQSETASRSPFQARADARPEISYQPQAHRRQTEMGLPASHHQVNQVKLHQKHRTFAYDHRAVDPRDRGEGGYAQASHPLSRSQVYSASTHDGVQERTAHGDHHRLVQDGNKHFALDRDPRPVYPPLPPLSSSHGLRRAASQTSASSTHMRTPEAFARPQHPSNGHSMHRTVPRSQRPTEAAHAMTASRQQPRLEEPRHVPHHPPHPRDQLPPSTSTVERRNGRGDHPHPVIASQHTGIQPGAEADLQRPSREVHAPSRPFKRQRAGSDTSLVLKSTRLTVAEAQAEIHRSTSSRVMFPTRQSEK